jgi:hypothetical protein
VKYGHSNRTLPDGWRVGVNRGFKFRAGFCRDFRQLESKVVVHPGFLKSLAAPKRTSKACAAFPAVGYQIGSIYLCSAHQSSGQGNFLEYGDFCILK